MAIYLQTHDGPTKRVPQTGTETLCYHHFKSLFRAVAYSFPLVKKVTGMDSVKRIATKCRVLTSSYRKRLRFLGF